MEIEGLQQVISIMKDWIPDDASVAVAVNGHYLYYISGIHDIRIKKGQEVEQGSIADIIFKKGHRVEGLMDDSIFGVSYYGIGYPITVHNQLGALVVILPTNYRFMSKEPLTFLTGKLNETWCPVAIEQVSYIESLQKKTWFYADNVAYSLIHTLKNLEFLLPDSFLRVHRSYIVNISHIEEISRDFASNIQLKLKDGAMLPVSQTYSNPFRTKLGF